MFLQNIHALLCSIFVLISLHADEAPVVGRVRAAQSKQSWTSEQHGCWRPPHRQHGGAEDEVRGKQGLHYCITFRNQYISRNGQRTNDCAPQGEGETTQHKRPTRNTVQVQRALQIVRYARIPEETGAAVGQTVQPPTQRRLLLPLLLLQEAASHIRFLRNK